eukprot:s539_g18.t1
MGIWASRFFALDYEDDDTSRSHFLWFSVPGSRREKVWQSLASPHGKRCKPIPPLAATIQCVNHAGSSISSPDFDSYLTLYYPEDGWPRQYHLTRFIQGSVAVSA